MNVLAEVGLLVDLFEGATFTNDPVDYGHETKFGVTRAVYSEYLGLPAGSLCDVDDIRHLTRAQAIGCLAEIFVLKPGLFRIRDAHLRVATIDLAIHSGPKTAIKALQRAASVHADGIFGPDTEAAVNAIEATVLRDRLIAARLELVGSILSRNPSQAKWARGWLRRIGRVLTLTPAELAA